MAIQYDVKAHVIDIAVDIPCSTDSIFVDSNVWFWQTYTRATAAGRRYQTIRYPNYIRSALRRGAKLYYSGLSFAELAHTIEKAEFDFGRATGIITSST